jgi:hypothetical protein
MVAKVRIKKKACRIIKNSRRCPRIGYLATKFWSKVAAPYYLGYRNDGRTLAMVVRRPRNCEHVGIRISRCASQRCVPMNVGEGMMVLAEFSR